MPKYRAVNVTAEPDLLPTPHIQDLIVDGQLVRPHEEYQFNDFTQDILAGMYEGTLRVTRADGTPVRFDRMAEEGLVVNTTVKLARTRTVDGIAYVRSRHYAVFPLEVEEADEQDSPDSDAASKVGTDEDAPANGESAPTATEEPSTDDESTEDAPADDAPVQEPEENAPVSVVPSHEMKAAEAVAYINDNEVADLAGFVTEEESRKTVLDAWAAKAGA